MSESPSHGETSPTTIEVRAAEAGALLDVFPGVSGRVASRIVARSQPARIPTPDEARFASSLAVLDTFAGVAGRVGNCVAKRSSPPLQVATPEERRLAASMAEMEVGDAQSQAEHLDVMVTEHEQNDAEAARELAINVAHDKAWRNAWYNQILWMVVDIGFEVSLVAAATSLVTLRSIVLLLPTTFVYLGFLLWFLRPIKREFVSIAGSLESSRSEAPISFRVFRRKKAHLYLVGVVFHVIYVLFACWLIPNFLPKHTVLIIALGILTNTAWLARMDNGLVHKVVLDCHPSDRTRQISYLQNRYPSLAKIRWTRRRVWLPVAIYVSISVFSLYFLIPDKIMLVVPFAPIMMTLIGLAGWTAKNTNRMELAILSVWEESLSRPPAPSI